MDYKGFIESLHNEAVYQRIRFGRDVIATELESAATAIETLLAERDAAVKDLVTAESCKTCGNMSSWCADNPDMCMGYKWRGVPHREATP